MSAILALRKLFPLFKVFQTVVVKKIGGYSNFGVRNQPPPVSLTGGETIGSASPPIILNPAGHSLRPVMPTKEASAPMA
jgi:hypothetical protein